MSSPLLDQELLRRIPLSARTVLHVGCGNGALTAAYQLMNPTARLLGIDTDPDAVSLAAVHMTEVAATDATDHPLPFDVPDGIDCIIYSGILEQIGDPWTLIRRHAEALSPDGVMLIRVPNVEHWTIADRLLRGSFNNTASTTEQLLHPQWFSPDSMNRTLSEASLSLCDVIRYATDSEQRAARPFLDAVTPTLTTLGIDPDEYAKRAVSTHLIWRVRKQSRPRMHVSGNMLTPVGGVSHVRVVHPFQAIATDPLFTTSVTDKFATAAAVDDTARIFVLHRPALTPQRGAGILRTLMEAGYLIITEFDDHPEFFKMMQEGGEISFRGVHAIQTSTPLLAEVMRKYNPEIAVFPNAVSSLPPVRNFTDPDTVTFFFGALNRERDWRPLIPAINAVAAQAGDRLRFQIVHDQHFFAALESPHKTFTPTCDYETYQALLGSSEISFMPLSDTPFNRAKSDLKFIEAGSCRVAPLASTVVYSDSIEDGRTGLLFRDATEFHSRLSRMVAMPELVRDLGDAARQYVKQERMLAYQVADRTSWYRSLWKRRNILTAALQTRLNDGPRAAA